MAPTVRLGGMALANGVLVHGPTAWAAAIRDADGELRVAAEPKRFRAATVTNPLLRGPARLAEAVAVLPAMRRALPQARLPFERPAVVAAILASSGLVRVVRGSDRFGAAAQELLAAMASVGPAALALRGGELAAYHGAEHVSIGSYEHGRPRPREHERCGSHLVAPMLATGAVASALAARAPAHLRGPARALGSVGAVAGAVELFSWSARHPDHPLARALARPGHELQRRFATADPSPAQLEVAEAALRACLRLEEAA